MGLQYLALDAGNWGVKARTESSEDFFLHGIIELSEAEYRKILARHTSDETKTEIIKVNGTPYAIGNTAKRNGFSMRRVGAERYEKDYYGVMAAAVMFRNFDRNMHQLLVYGSHAPRDIDYRTDMRFSLVGEYEVEYKGMAKQFTVIDARQIDEPVAGLYNIMFTTDGRMNSRSKLTMPKDKDDLILQLVVDIGGITTDFAVVENGAVDYLSTRSAELGIISVTDRFWADVTTEHRTKLKSGARNFDDRRKHKALRTGILDAGGLGKLDVSFEATQALNEFMADVIGWINRFEGKTMHDIILTGGGAAVVYDRLCEMYQHPNIILAGEDPENMHMANVNGAMKALRVLKNRGALNEYE